MIGFAEEEFNNIQKKREEAARKWALIVEDMYRFELNDENVSCALEGGCNGCEPVLARDKKAKKRKNSRYTPGGFVRGWLNENEEELDRQAEYWYQLLMRKESRAKYEKEVQAALKKKEEKRDRIMRKKKKRRLPGTTTAIGSWEYKLLQMKKN